MSESNQPEYGQSKQPEYGAMAGQYPGYDPYLYGHPDADDGNGQSGQSQAGQDQSGQSVSSQAFQRPPAQGSPWFGQGGRQMPQNRPYGSDSGQTPYGQPYGQPNGGAMPGNQNYPGGQSGQGNQSGQGSQYGPAGQPGASVPARPNQPYNPYPYGAPQPSPAPGRSGQPGQQFNGTQVGPLHFNIDLNDPNQNPMYGRWDFYGIMALVFTVLWPVPVIPALMGAMSMWRTRTFHMKGFWFGLIAVILNVIYTVVLLWLTFSGYNPTNLMQMLANLGAGAGSGGGDTMTA